MDGIKMDGMTMDGMMTATTWLDGRATMIRLLEGGVICLTAAKLLGMEQTSSFTADSSIQGTTMTNAGLGLTLAALERGRSVTGKGFVTQLMKVACLKTAVR